MRTTKPATRSNHRTRNRSCSIAACLLAAATLPFAAGCHAPQPPEGPTRMLVQVDSEADQARLWDAATDALQDHYFELDRVDRFAGVITTRPETAGNWFEFWRPQSAEPYHWWENNLHTIQRIAQVRLARNDDLDAYELDVQVHRQRFHLEERQIDNAAAALRLYSSDVPTTTGKMGTIEQTDYTSDVGRDLDMEHKLLNAILLNYQHITPPQLAADPDAPAVGSSTPETDPS